MALVVLPRFLASWDWCLSLSPARCAIHGPNFSQDCQVLLAEASIYTILVYSSPESRIPRLPLLSRPLMKGSRSFVMSPMMLCTHPTVEPSACRIQPTLCEDCWSMSKAFDNQWEPNMKLCFKQLFCNSSTSWTCSSFTSLGHFTLLCPVFPVNWMSSHQAWFNSHQAFIGRNMSQVMLCISYYITSGSS